MVRGEAAAVAERMGVRRKGRGRGWQRTSICHVTELASVALGGAQGESDSLLVSFLVAVFLAL